MSYDEECIYIECLDVGTINGGGVSGVIGNPTFPRVWDPLVGIQPTDTVANAVWKLESKTVLLFPQPPPALGTLTINIGSLYSAYISTAVLTLVTDLINNTSPQTNTVGPFYDGSDGILTAYVKFDSDPESDQGSVVLTPASNVGTYGALTVVTDADTTTPSGFYMSLTAYIKYSTFTPSNSIQYSYRMNHSITGSTNTLAFHVDDAITPSVSSQTITSIGGTPNYISGVPSLGSSSIINVSFTVNNAIKLYFHAVATALISGSVVSAGQLPIAIDRTPGANPLFSFAAVPASVYTENATITCAGQSSDGSTGNAVASYSGGPLRIDYPSVLANESTLRVTSGVGNYPASGYNSAYNSNTSLLLNEEAQLLNGLFQYPTGNYTTFTPAGPDYSGISDAYRWVTFNLGNHDLTIAQFTFNNSVGLNAIKPVWKLQIILLGGSGPTQWVDGNEYYPGVGNPGAGLTIGDPALVLASSTNTSKYITFGSVYYTGVTVIVRVGLPLGSSIKFSDITASYL